MGLAKTHVLHDLSRMRDAKDSASLMESRVGCAMSRAGEALITSNA